MSNESKRSLISLALFVTFTVLMMTGGVITAATMVYASPHSSSSPSSDNSGSGSSSSSSNGGNSGSSGSSSNDKDNDKDNDKSSSASSNSNPSGGSNPDASSDTTTSGPNTIPSGPSGTAPNPTNPSAPSPGPQEITPPGQLQPGQLQPGQEITPPGQLQPGQEITPPGQPAPSGPVTPPVITTPLVEPITCKPNEVLQDGKCVPKPTTTCKPNEVLQNGKCTPPPPPVCINVPGQIAKCPPPPPPVCKYPYHRVGNHCELNKNCHYDKDRLGRFTRDITCVIIVRGHTQETHSHSNSGSNYVGTSSSLTQIPSKVTDYPSNDPSIIQVHVTSAKKDVIGSYHIIGEITNNANSPIHNVKVTVHFYDANNGLVGISTCCYTTPIKIDAGHTATFDSFVTSDQISGTPVSYRLSYDWS